MPKFTKIVDTVYQTACEILVMTFIVKRFSQTHVQLTGVEFTGSLSQEVAKAVLSPKAQEQL